MNTVEVVKCITCGNLFARRIRKKRPRVLRGSPLTLRKKGSKTCCPKCGLIYNHDSEKRKTKSNKGKRKAVKNS